MDVQAYPRFSGEPLRAAVVGCATSHRRLAQWLAASEFPMLLVLEDDVVPCSNDPTGSVLDIAVRLLPAALRGESFVCHLGTRLEQLNQSLRRPLKSSASTRNDRRLWQYLLIKTFRFESFCCAFCDFQASIYAAKMPHLFCSSF